MKIKVATVSKMTFIYIVIYGMFSRYIEYSKIWNGILLFFFLVHFLLLNNQNIIIKSRMTTLFCLLSMLFIILSTILGVSNRYFSKNFRIYLWPMLIVLLLLNCAYNVRQKEMINQCFLPFNIMWTVNLVILQFQNMGNSIMIKDTWLSANSYYQDLCCGLFGLNGTHELCLFAAFMFVYNMYYADIVAKRTQKKIIVAYTLLTEVYHLVQSTMNDNVSAFIIIPMFCLIFILLRSQWKYGSISKKIVTFFKYFLFIFILVVIAFSIPSINDFVKVIVAERINLVININPGKVNGSNERLAIFAYAITNDWAWRLGKGFGTYGINGIGTGGFLGFSHFGLNNLGSFVVLGGVWTYLFHVLFISSALKDMLVKNREKSNLLFLCFAIVIILTVYTVPFTSPVLMIWIGLIFFVLGLLRDDYLHKEVNGNGQFSACKCHYSCF